MMAVLVLTQSARTYRAGSVPIPRGP